MLSHVRFGTGPISWLAFHGIGQDAQTMAPFGERLAQTHTIYSIDLPFHGQDRHTGKPADITKPYWQSLIADFLEAKQINRFSVVGFSIGGRFALVIAERFAHRLDELILLAPDGVSENPWFRAATHTPVGRWALRFFLDHSHFFLQQGQLLVRLGLLNAALLRFLEATLQTPAQREQISRSWIGFRTLTSNIPALAKLLRANQVRTWLFLGQFDAVLSLSHTRPLTHALPETIQLILPCGHTSLVRRVAAGWPFR